MEIGAHSVSHPCLPTCSDSELAYELNDAKVLLEQQLGSEITSFSYPHGLYDDRVKRFVSAAGFRLGCTSVCGVNRHSFGSLELHRTEISGADDMAIFRRKLAGQYDWMGLWQRWQARKS
jgi:peptidoglycan/xylan/chitin deacetylase (PgdA/CDA1 family)